MNKKVISVLVTMLIMIFTLAGCSIEYKENPVSTQDINIEENTNTLSSAEDINLRDLDGQGTNYIFTYNNQDFSAKYTKDNWHITDSYKITNSGDIGIICQTLIDIHPIHGKDMKSYRKVDDLVYEWQQHNLAYNLLSDDNSWKEHAKDVDLNPADQGKSLAEIYEDRTGKKLSVEKLKNVKKSTKTQKIKNKVKGIVEKFQ